MDFDLREEQKQFQRFLRETCERILKPKAVQVDELGMVPEENLQELARAGYMGLLIPEALGGNNGDMTCFLVGTEEVARCCPSTALVAGTSLMRFGLPTILYASQAQKQRILPRLARGDLRGAWAHTESQGGCDTENLTTWASSRQDGFSLCGRKDYVLNGPEASALLVAARVNAEAGCGKSTGVFLLEEPCQGLKRSPVVRTVGARGARICSLELEDCILPRDSLLGGEAGPSAQAVEELPHMPLLMAGYSIGVGQAALELSIHYARQRATFGRPIVSYQEVHFRIADMYVNVDVARQLALRAAWLIDVGRGSTVESSLAKLFASEMGLMCGQSCAHIHGGRGLLDGSQADRLLRDSRMGLILGGTVEMHRLGIARQVLAGKA
ncbi:MAG: acyl-CoA dehydrogenase family protein [bacterium]